MSLLYSEDDRTYKSHLILTYIHKHKLKSLVPILFCYYAQLLNNSRCNDCVLAREAAACVVKLNVIDGY